ncbi:MAG: hypothetical protein Q609_ECAC01465G0002, partial [Escherichia coli DORA_A_5_14_21]
MRNIIKLALVGLLSVSTIAVAAESSIIKLALAGLLSVSTFAVAAESS